MKIRFNRTPLVVAGGHLKYEPGDSDIKATPALFNADLETAARYGGDLTRDALSAMNLRGDRKYIVVDTKIHMLMPGFMPAIPGWHTDGVPRGPERNPASKGAPDIAAQEQMEERKPLFHLMVAGGDCPTRFCIERALELDVPDTPDAALYAMVSEQMNALATGGLDGRELKTLEAVNGSVYEWDWWQLHTAIRAREFGWRFLIRVTESDWHIPQRDIASVIRTQQQVYVPDTFGW
jgi:hypothetical protein